MSSFWESKYLSSEKSVQFLQQTHAEILKGLHDEIDNLQKQCSDYALKLSMRASTEIEKEELDQKFKSFNAEYMKKDALISDQQNLIYERNKNIKNLTDRVKSLEKKLEIESNPKDVAIKQLKKELEIKSAQIANLTYQLHNANKSNKSNNISDKETLNNNINNMNLNESLISPNYRKKKSTNRQISQRFDENVNNIDYVDNMSVLNHPSKTSINLNNGMHERRMSAESLIDGEDNLLFKGTANSLKSYANQRLTASMSSTNSAVSDRSENAHINELKNKLLPPVAVVKRSLDPNVPDPKPFLQSMSSTLHSRSKNKEILQRRALIALPQIKPYDTSMLSQLAVESPLKSINHHGQSEYNNKS